MLIAHSLLFIEAFSVRKLHHFWIGSTLGMMRKKVFGYIYYDFIFLFPFRMAWWCVSVYMPMGGKGDIVWNFSCSAFYLFKTLTVGCFLIAVQTHNSLFSCVCIHSLYHTLMCSLLRTEVAVSGSSLRIHLSHLSFSWKFNKMTHTHSSSQMI